MSIFIKSCLVFATLTTPAVVLAHDPACDGVDNWASNMAFVYLKNAGITDNYKVLWDHRKVVRLASEKIGKNLYRQVHLVTFVEKGGNTIEVITVNDALNEECSMSAVEAYVVSNRLGGK